MEEEELLRLTGFGFENEAFYEPRGTEGRMIRYAYSMRESVRREHIIHRIANIVSFIGGWCLGNILYMLFAFDTCVKKLRNAEGIIFFARTPNQTKIRDSILQESEQIFPVPLTGPLQILRGKHTIFRRRFQVAKKRQLTASFTRAYRIVGALLRNKRLNHKSWQKNFIFGYRISVVYDRFRDLGNDLLLRAPHLQSIQVACHDYWTEIVICSMLEGTVKTRLVMHGSAGWPLGYRTSADITHAPHEADVATLKKISYSSTYSFDYPIRTPETDGSRVYNFLYATNILARNRGKRTGDLYMRGKELVDNCNSIVVDISKRNQLQGFLRTHPREGVDQYSELVDFKDWRELDSDPGFVVSHRSSVALYYLSTTPVYIYLDCEKSELDVYSPIDMLALCVGFSNTDELMALLNLSVYEYNKRVRSFFHSLESPRLEPALVTH